MAGIDSSKISPSNPFEKSGGTAKLLQAAVGEIDPAQAARWRVAAGSSLSIATLAEMQSGQQLSQKAMQDLWQHDAAFVVDSQRAKVENEAALLASMSAEADAMRLRNKTREMGGNEARAREVLATKAAAEDARKAKQVEAARMAGRLV